MKQSTYSVVVLEPSDGYTLTQSAEVELAERILSKKVYLAINDSPDNWKEITDAEADEIRFKQEELNKPTEEIVE